MEKVTVFRELMQGVQALILSLGALAAGLWALFQFRTTQAAKRARLELDEIELRSRRQAALSVSIQASHRRLRPSGQLAILASATLTNTGNRNTHLVTDHPPFYARRVESSATEPHAYIQGLSAEIDFVCRTGVTHTFQDVILIPDGGLYEVGFLVKLSRDELSVAHEAGQGDRHEDIFWTASAFIGVDADPQE